MFKSRGLFNNPKATGHGVVFGVSPKPTASPVTEPDPPPPELPGPAKRKLEASSVKGNVAKKQGTSTAYDKTKAHNILELIKPIIENELRGSTYRDDHNREEFVRRFLLTLLEDCLSTESSDHAPEATLPEVIVERLQATAQALKQPKVFNSDAGRAMLHAFYQGLADPELGRLDPNLQAISKALNANLDTVSMCFEERKVHGLGYVPPKKERADKLEEWLVEVLESLASQLAVSSFLLGVCVCVCF